MGSGVCCVTNCEKIQVKKDIALIEHFNNNVQPLSPMCLSERLLKVRIKTIKRNNNNNNNNNSNSNNKYNNCEQCLQLIHKNKINDNNIIKHKQIRTVVNNSKSTSNVFDAIGKCSEFLLTFDYDTARMNNNNNNNDNNSNNNIKDNTTNNNNNNNSNTNNNMDIHVKELSQEECDKLIHIFQNNFLIEGLSIEEITLIIRNLVEVDFNDGMEIYDEDFDGNFFFIIAKGKVNIIENGKIIKTYTQWECFGDLSLFSKVFNMNVIQSTAKCEGNVVLYILDGNSFRIIQNELMNMRYEEQYNFVKQIPIFCNLDAISKYTLAEKILIKEYDQGNIIINTHNKNSDSYFKYRSHSNFSRISSKILSNQNNTSNNNNNTGNTGNNNNNNNNEESDISHTHSQFTYDLLFLIKNGNVSIEKQGKRIQTLSHGEYFGVNNILFDNLPSKKEKLSIIANDHVTLYEISKAGLIEALGFNYKETLLFSLFKTIIQNNKYFNLIFNEKSLLKIFKTFKLIRYNNHDDIYVEGKSKLRMIIIIDGNIKNQKTKTIIAKAGDIIGEHCFQNKHTVLCNGLIAFNSLITLESEINEVFNILNLDIESIQQLKKLKRLNQLKRISLFKYLQHDLIEKISETVSIEKYALNDVIIKENCKGDKCYFIMKGSVQVYEKGKFIRELEKGSFFGERALIDHNDIRTATVIAKSFKVICFVLSKSNFNLIFNNENSRKYIEHKISMHNSDMSLTQLYYIKQIGKGKYGNVFLVHNNKNTYALKVMPIKQVSKDKIGTYVVSEKNIMKCIDHPFIIKLVQTLRDENYVYFILEHINGQTLDEYLSSRCVFKQVHEVQFYSACLLIILEYLNSKNIVHRDIKPSNIMLDKHAYPHLIDFGTAKVVNDYTTTVIGTPEYTAPEIINGKGYSLSCDFWSVGIIAYEIYYGKCPFGGSDVIAIYKNILNQDIKYLNTSQTKDVDEFIMCLLQRKVNQRVCKVNELKEKDLFMINNDDMTTYKKDYFEMVMDMEVKGLSKIKENHLTKNWNEGNKELIKDYLRKVLGGESTETSSAVVVHKESEEEGYGKWVEEF